MSKRQRADDLRDDLDAAGISRISRIPDDQDRQREADGDGGGSRSTLPSYDARKLNAPAPAPRDGHVFAWDPSALDAQPINPNGPGILGTQCGFPSGGHNHG